MRIFVFFFKQKPAYELRISDWSSDVCSSDLYFDPRALLVANTVEQQQAFEDFLAAHPERFTREAPAPGDPFSVGKIVFIDATQTNLSSFRSEALAFSGDYKTAIGEGPFSLNGNSPDRSLVV